MAGQIEHWARLGQALEAQPDVDLARIRAVLTGALAFDTLNSDERPLALAELEGQVLAANGDRELQRELLAQGRSYSAAVGGRVIVVAPGASRGGAPKAAGKRGLPSVASSPKSLLRAASGKPKGAARTRTAKKR